MAAVAQSEAGRHAERRRYQEEVERLLEQIGRGTRRLQVLKAGGAKAQGLAELKQELRGARRRLASLTARP